MFIVYMCCVEIVRSQTHETLTYVAFGYIAVQNTNYLLDAFVLFLKGDTGTPGIPGLDGRGGHPVSIF